MKQSDTALFHASSCEPARGGSCTHPTADPKTIRNDARIAPLKLHADSARQGSALGTGPGQQATKQEGDRGAGGRRPTHHQGGAPAVTMRRSPRRHLRLSGTPRSPLHPPATCQRPWCGRGAKIRRRIRRVTKPVILPPQKEFLVTVPNNVPCREVCTGRHLDSVKHG